MIAAEYMLSYINHHVHNYLIYGKNAFLCRLHSCIASNDMALLAITNSWPWLRFWNCVWSPQLQQPLLTSQHCMQYRCRICTKKHSSRKSINYACDGSYMTTCNSQQSSDEHVIVNDWICWLYYICGIHCVYVKIIICKFE